MAEQQTIYFRVRGGANYGWGHVVRQVALARHLLMQADIMPWFLVEGDEGIQAYLQETGLPATLLTEGLSLQNEAALLKALDQNALLIADLTDATPALQTLWASHFRFTLIFDDLLEQSYHTDYAICGQPMPGKGARDFDAPHTRVLQGHNYFLMRPEFAAVRQLNRPCPEQVNRTLVFLGGGHYPLALLKASTALGTTFPEAEHSIVTGGKAHSALISELNTRIPGARFVEHVADVPELLNQTDLAIVAGGYTKLEAAFMGVPSVILSTQWHQIPLSQEFSRLSGIPYAGHMTYCDIDDLMHPLALLRNAEARKAQTQKAAALLDGRGIERITALIAEALNGPG